METDAWVDDDYYVGEDGAMLVNQWVKVADDDDSKLIRMMTARTGTTSTIKVRK